MLVGVIPSGGMKPTAPVASAGSGWPVSLPSVDVGWKRKNPRFVRKSALCNRDFGTGMLVIIAAVGMQRDCKVHLAAVRSELHSLSKSLVGQLESRRGVINAIEMQLVVRRD